MPLTRRQLISPSAKPGRYTPAGERRADPAPVPTLAQHAANRLMFGPAPGDVAAIEALGYDAFLQQQLNPTSITDTACDAAVNALPRDTYAETWAQLYDRRNLATWTEVIKPFVQVRHATVTRMAKSKRQLYERMVEFWHNHFNIYGLDYITRSMWTKWDETIRANALGNFRTFLEATAKHPAMLYYLDNYTSTDGGPNENYARELFELHTLGSMNYQEPGGYIDRDVYEASRCFTGWTFEQESNSANAGYANRGQFKYVAEDHDRFLKIVLGTIINNDNAAMVDGGLVLDMLAYHPGTAKHIATKLARRFIADDPPQAVIDSTAQVFIDNKNDPNQIRKVLEHLLSSVTFKETRGNKFKRPVDWLISSMRALQLPYITHDAFYWAFDRMGQKFFEWTPPNGPPDTAYKWITSNAFQQRWNYMTTVAAGWYTDYNFTITATGLMPAGKKTPRDVVEWWVERTHQRAVSAQTLDGLMQFVAEGRNYDIEMPSQQIDDKIRHLAAMCCLTPDFMRR